MSDFNSMHVGIDSSTPYNQSGLGNSGSFLTNLLSGNKGPDPYADLASLFGKSAQADASNRYMKGVFQQNTDQQALADQTGRNQNEGDALKKLNQTSYIMGGGSTFKPPTPSINGKTYNLPDLGLGPAPITPAMKQAAGTLQSQLMTRLAPGGSVTPTDVSKFATPGTGEKVKSALGGAASGAGIGTMIAPGIGTAAGAIIGGLLGLF